MTREKAWQNRKSQGRERETDDGAKKRQSEERDNTVSRERARLDVSSRS